MDRIIDLLLKNKDGVTAPLMINENNNGSEIEIFLIFFSPSPLLAATKNFSQEMICAQ